MSKDRRKLLPYEHDLIKALGVTKEEYFDFLDVRHEYTDIKAGTVLDARNWEVVAIVLTVVGVIFQVVAALIAPKPQNPAIARSGGGGVRQTRDDVFAPRGNFNSLQQVAEYGDVVNLVYTNQAANRNGGVRVATSLVWSALRSYGSSQFIQMMAIIGAGKIGQIDPKLTAFGQTPMRDLITQNYWVYFNDYSTGFLKNSDLLPDPYGIPQENDPTRIGNDAANPYRVPTGERSTDRSPGFSQSFSLSASKSFGVYSPVAINVNVTLRNEDGDQQAVLNGVTVSINNNAGWPQRLASVGLGTVLVVNIAKTSSASNLEIEASEYRQQIVNIFDNASIFKLGSAVFSVTDISFTDLSSNAAIITLRCVDGGNLPSVDYNDTSVNDVSSITTTGELAKQSNLTIRNLQSTIDRIVSEDETGDAISEIFTKNAIERIIQTSRLATNKELAEYRGLRDRRELENYFWQDGALRKRITSRAEKRKLTTEERQFIRAYLDAQATSRNISVEGLDLFRLKALVRIEKAKYETITPCNIVDIAIKSNVYRRISGRQETYGKERRSGYPSSDNGLKLRSAFFLFKYKKASDSSYKYAPGIFVIRRASEQDNFNYLRFNSGLTGEDSATHWSFELEPLHDFAAELRKHPVLSSASGINYFYIENSGTPVSFDLARDDDASLIFTGKTVISKGGVPPLSSGPGDAREWEVFSLNADTQYQLSLDRGPEMQITAVTEQVVVPNFSTLFPDIYKDIALIGLNMYSGKSVQDLRSLSVFVQKGRATRMLRTSGQIGTSRWGDDDFPYLPESLTIGVNQMVPNTSYIIELPGNTNYYNVGLPRNLLPQIGQDFIATGPGSGTGRVRAAGYANTAPDIFVDTVLDPNDGIGKYASIHCMNLKELAKAKRFCERNSLFMDCVIAEAQSWRSFWSSIGGFSLLELARIGGQDCLVPAIPYDFTTGEISRNIKIIALFNQGNIFEDSYKEEFIDYGSNTEDLIVTCIYRELDSDGAFTRNRSVEVKRTYVNEQKTVLLNESDAIRETIDMSAYVANRSQAILVGKMLCQLRHYVRRAIEFKTFPTDSPVFPGSFIYVETGHNEWNNIFTGIVRSNGVLDMPIRETGTSAFIPDGVYNVLTYNPNDGATSTLFRAGVNIVDNKVTENSLRAGHLFVLGKEVRSKRIFRVTEVEMDEEGEVTIRGVEHPCDSNGLSLVTEGLTRGSTGIFTIDGVAS